MWADLPEDVFRELTDPNFMDRTHGKRATSKVGCTGPLCRKADRERKAEQRRAAAIAAGKEYKTHARSKGDIHRDEELNKIMAWHWLVRTSPKPREEILNGLVLRAATMA